MDASTRDDFYRALGKLFFAVAASDARITKAERISLHHFVKNIWNPQEAAVDAFGTSLATEIEFSFDFEEADALPEEDFAEFADFFANNQRLFSPIIKENIRKTAKAIASAYRGENKKEKRLLTKLGRLLNS